MNFVDTDFSNALKRLSPDSDLEALREDVAKTERRLQVALHNEDYSAAAVLRDQVREMRLRDPVSLESSVRAQLDEALRHEEFLEAAKFRDQLDLVRRYLPQFRLKGVWKGLYPSASAASRKEECAIRIEYDGDMLIATKLTGDRHVPAGEITFRVNVSNEMDPDADTTEHGFKIVVQDGDQAFSSFLGEGRVARKGFTEDYYVPGQLYLLDDDTILFLWGQNLDMHVEFSRDEDEDPDVRRCSYAAAKIAEQGGDLRQIYGKPSSQEDRSA
jgi:hypothetical protein